MSVFKGMIISCILSIWICISQIISGADTAAILFTAGIVIILIIATILIRALQIGRRYNAIENILVFVGVLVQFMAVK